MQGSFVTIGYIWKNPILINIALTNLLKPNSVFIEVCGDFFYFFYAKRIASQYSP